MRITVNGVALNYEEKGKGTPLFLLHGFGGDLTYWDAQIGALSQKFRVIAYDQRGSGKSDFPANGFRITEFIEDQRQLMLALKASPAFLMGFSRGGAIAMQVALTFPDLVLGLVMHDASTDFASPKPELSSEQRQRSARLLEIITDQGMAAFADFFIPQNFSGGLKERQPLTWRRYHEMLKGNRKETLIGVIKAGIENPSPSYDLRRLKCPVLFITGEYDEMIPAEKRKRAQESVPVSEMVVIPGAGHASAAESPAAFNRAAIKFLEKHRRKIRPGILKLTATPDKMVEN